MSGANHKYIEPLVKVLLTYLHQNQKVKLDSYLIPCYDIQQNDGHSCGVAVISLIKRIQERYQCSMSTIVLGSFDFN